MGFKGIFRLYPKAPKLERQELNRNVSFKTYKNWKRFIQVIDHRSKVHGALIAGDYNEPCLITRNIDKLFRMARRFKLDVSLKDSPAFSIDWFERDEELRPGGIASLYISEEGFRRLFNEEPPTLEESRAYTEKSIDWK